MSEVSESRSGDDLIFKVKTKVKTKTGKTKTGRLVATDGDLVFRLANGTDALRFQADGTVLVRGEKVDENEVVYAAFCAWLTLAIGTNNYDNP